MAGRFSRLRRTRDDDPAPSEATDALPASDGDRAPAEGAVAASEAEAGATGATVVTEPAPAEGETAATELQLVEPLPEGEAEPEPAGEPGFIARGKLRRRLRYVRRAREIALRDLGGLVFELHRFERDRGDLVEQKLASLSALDAEMRALEQALDEHLDVTVLREPGLATCPRCGALRASDASYCSSCGLPLGRGASLPAGPTLAGAPAEAAQPTALEPPAATDPPAGDAPPPTADEPPTRVS